MTHFVPPKLSTGLPVSITKRQAEVLALAFLGLTDAAIGRRLFITVGTVRTHMRRLLKRIGATDRTHAMALIYSGQVVEISEPKGSVKE